MGGKSSSHSDTLPWLLCYSQLTRQLYYIIKGCSQLRKQHDRARQQSVMTEPHERAEGKPIDRVTVVTKVVTSSLTVKPCSPGGCICF